MFSEFGSLTTIMIAMVFIAAVLVLPAFLVLTLRGKEREDAKPSL